MNDIRHGRLLGSLTAGSGATIVDFGGVLPASSAAGVDAAAHDVAEIAAA